MRRGDANLLCIIPIPTDDSRRSSHQWPEALRKNCRGALPELRATLVNLSDSGVITHSLIILPPSLPPSFPPSSLPPSLSPSLCPYIYMISIIHITVPLEDRVPDGHNVLPGAAKHLQGTRLPSDRLFGAAHGIRSTIWCEAFETNGALERSALQARRVAGVGVVASFPASSSGPRSCCRSWCTAGGVHTCVCIIP